MSINSALNSAVSGLVANSSALSAISQNIANSNTVGYKQESTQFEDLVGASSSAGNYSAGGVQANTQQLVSQNGTPTQTTSSTDLSITGNGLFVVTSTPTPTSSDTRSYTEAGSFTVDANGDLVNAAGYYLQGFPVNTDGTVTVNPSDLNTLQTINVAAIGGTATATSTVTVNQNLNSTQALSANAQLADPAVTVTGATPPSTIGTVSGSVALSPTALAAANQTGNALVTVTNSTGQVVYTGTPTIASLVSTPSFTWDGTANDNGGTAEPNGAYNITVTDPSGNSLTSGAYNPITNSLASYEASGGTQGVKPDATITIPISNSQGGQQTVEVYLQKSTAANTWNAEVVAPGGDIQYGANSTLSDNQLATGTLVFNSTGTLDLKDSTLFGGSVTPTLNFGASSTTPSTANAYAWGANLGIAGQSVALNLATAPGGITQYDSATLTQSIDADGTAFGNLNTVSIDSKGFVTATYSNGVSKQIAQVAVATFANPDGLTEVNGDAYQVSTTSGSFNLKTPGSAGAGTISPDTLEASTVDLSSQFADLITTQQAYSASAKVITTADQMEQSLIATIQ